MLIFVLIYWNQNIKAASVSQYLKPETLDKAWLFEKEAGNTDMEACIFVKFQQNNLTEEVRKVHELEKIIHNENGGIRI